MGRSSAESEASSVYRSYFDFLLYSNSYYVCDKGALLLFLQTTMGGKGMLLLVLQTTMDDKGVLLLVLQTAMGD